MLTALLEAKFIARKEAQNFISDVKVKIIDTSSIAAVTNALRGQDAFVDATSGSNPNLSGRFIEAAVSAGVYRFVMSESSADP